ncbi:hypothetical protein [Streptomyces erythrochromogenes]|uniref:hypothetical protein n=1 Tax=Streptomyces erythrochromogenes TaxID=285574 RepID=UPI00368F3822
MTPATVRSWECGRTAPRGVRREAYRRFLAGLAQHTSVDVPGPAVARPVPTVPTVPPVPPVPQKAAPPEVVPRKAVPPSPPPPVRVVGRVDQALPGRIRRLRVLGAAACAWSLAALWVVLTCPPPL